MKQRRKPKNPYPWVHSFNERKFEPYIRTIGQATLLWNDLHEHFGHLYCIAIGGGIVNAHFRVWNSLVNDRAKRGILLAAAEWTFCDGTFEQTDLDKKCFEAIRWLCTESQKVEDDRNNVIHAPLQKDRFGQVMPASLFGNKRAKNLENKHLIEEYQRLRDTTRLLRNYAAAVHDPMCGKRVAWPNTPRLPDRAATKIPQPLHQAPLEEPLLRLKP